MGPRAQCRPKRDTCRAGARPSRSLARVTRGQPQSRCRLARRPTAKRVHAAKVSTTSPTLVCSRPTLRRALTARGRGKAFVAAPAIPKGGVAALSPGLQSSSRTRQPYPVSGAVLSCRCPQQAIWPDRVVGQARPAEARLQSLHPAERPSRQPTEVACRRGSPDLAPSEAYPTQSLPRRAPPMRFAVLADAATPGSQSDRAWARRHAVEPNLPGLLHLIRPTSLSQGFALCAP